MIEHERYYCRLCDTRDLTEEAQRLIDEYLRSLPAESCVPDDLYRARLQACDRCPSLLPGGTCGECGCLVQVRAKKRGNGCPHPAGSRWTSQTGY